MTVSQVPEIRVFGCEVRAFFVEKPNEVRKTFPKDSTKNTATYQFTKDGYRKNSDTFDFSHHNRYIFQAKQPNKDNYNKWGPLQKLGNIKQYAMCKSIYHWDNAWPIKTREDVSKDVRVILLILILKSYVNSLITQFVGEKFRYAVLENGCTKTVCRHCWFE